MNKYNIKTTMLEEFEIRGLWYLPDTDLEEGVYGILTFTSSIISLKLMGSFKEDFDINNSVRDNVILGFSENGKHIYLDNCFIIKHTNNMPGLSMSDYQINTMFISSENIVSVNELALTKFNFSFANYDKWDLDSPIEIFINTTEQSESITYSVDQLKSIESKYSLEENKIDFSKRAVVTRNHINGFTKMEVSLEKYFEINFLDNKTYFFNDVKEYLQKFNDFYSILIGHRMNNKQLKIYNNSQEISVFWTQRIISPKNFIINHDDAKTSMQSLLTQFEKEYSSLSIILNTRANKSYKNGFDSDLFIDASKNLEVFARQYFDITPELPNNYEILKTELMNVLEENNVNQSDYSFFSNKISFIGERALRWKIKKCIQLIPNDLQKKIFGPNKNSKIVDRFCTTISDTRNHLTHGDSLSKYPLAITNPRELYYTTLKLNCILDYLLLQKIGVDENIITKSISRYDGPYQSIFF
ncbi:HEPN domain-containing protein [Vagococcus carniphilus]|uniref:ApeA N-terminal domain 1-containing protein n=1 Tax=Vagococcus carniphilus TaxID=218144 RepID=UPI003BA868DE